MNKFFASIIMSGIAASFLAGSAYGQCPAEYDRGYQGYYYGDRGGYGYNGQYLYDDQYQYVDQPRFDDRDQRRQQPANRQQAQDQQVKSEIQDHLRDYRNVNFTLRNGVVTLSGSVRSAQDKQNIEQDIREISGVRDVKNQLKVENRQQQR